MGLSWALRFATHRHTPPWKEPGWAKAHHTLFSWWWNVLHSRLGCANPLSPPVPTQSSLTSSSWRTRSGVGAWGWWWWRVGFCTLPYPSSQRLVTLQLPNWEGLLCSLNGGHWRLPCERGKGISPSKYAHQIQVWSCYTLRSVREDSHSLAWPWGPFTIWSQSTFPNSYHTVPAPSHPHT